MLLCCDDLGWMMGKIVKFKPRAKKFNFDVVWQGESAQQQGVKLGEYFKLGNTPVAGNWVYLEKSNPTSVRRPAASLEMDDDDGEDDAAMEPARARARGGEPEEKKVG